MKSEHAPGRLQLFHQYENEYGHDCENVSGYDHDCASANDHDSYRCRDRAGADDLHLYAYAAISGRKN